MTPEELDTFLDDLPDLYRDETLPTSGYGGDDLLSLLAPVDQALPVYVSHSGLFVYSAFAPREALSAGFEEDLLEWNCSPSSGYGSYSVRGGRPLLWPPLSSTGSTVLDLGAPVVFLRDFSASLGERPCYCEFWQHFLHVADLHWVPDKDGFCRLDENGDVVLAARTERVGDRILCWVDRESLDHYMRFTETILVRLFELIRSRDITLPPVTQRREEKVANDPGRGLLYRELQDFDESDALFTWSARGFQSLQPSEDFAEWSEQAVERKYETFVTEDMKSGDVIEASCDPALLSNYFQDSDDPHWMSMVCFRPEVLERFKSDPDKYTVTERWIQSRSGWMLRPYDLNPAGQVQSYLGYLGQLPYAEQKYFRSFNEAPKAGLSDRAKTSDFKGMPPASSPLQQLEVCLRGFPKATQFGNEVEVWRPVHGGLDMALKQLHPIATDSRKEYKEQIDHLASLLVDGINKKAAKKLAKKLSCYDKELGSLKLIAICMEALAVPEEEVQSFLALKELWDERSTLKHGSSLAPSGERRQIHAKRVSESLTAMLCLSEWIRAGRFDVS